MLKDAFTIKELFAKNIERNINGVIQAGQLDEDTKHEELSEYVMTREIEENMAYFYQNYVKSLEQPTTAVGVWISGFFGSGKSHFLKILSYLLDNKTVYGIKPVDYFSEKTNNQTLLEQMRLVASYDTHSILFNIDSKSAASGRPGDQKEMIVEVFLKAFNEYLGYSSTLWIADIERQIAEASDYEAFKQAFYEVDGTKWEEIRAQIKFKRKSFKEALKRIGVEEETAEDLLASANREFSISSEEFAKMVAKHCEKQGPKYRLTFFVDEVGQYIGDDRRLMLNLQTVVEDLGKSCRGRVWVVVTAQEQINALTKIAGYDDYSKIQGRFPIRINLTSSNTDEVIQRRLLEKTEPAKDELFSRYDMDHQSLQNLLAFDRNHTVLRSGYRSAEEFVNFYPFVPYQIDLLQKVFEKVRIQGEAGKHLAHGERSLLNSIQEVAIALKDEGTDRLARFSQFYGTIKRFLDSSIVNTINRARKRDGIDDFDIEVLQVLYMIKGIQEIKATVENITTLLIDSVDTIKSDVEKRVRQSLRRLKSGILIQENADQTFTFLSDDEQEIQREIERTRINETNLDAKLGKEFFNEIYSAPRIMYQGVPFEFNKRFNDFVKGTTAHELTLHVVTRDLSEEQARLQSHSGTVIMRIPDELAETFEEPLAYAERIDSYLRLKNSSDLTQQYRQIFNDLRTQMGKFEQQAKEKLALACQEAVFYIDGKDYKFPGTVKDQVEKALAKLIENTYPKLGYIDRSVPEDKAKETIQEWGQHGLPKDTTQEFANRLAFEEMLRYLERQPDVVLKQVNEVFTKRPYGWCEKDIAGVVAGLDHAGKVELTYLNDPLRPDQPDYPVRLLRKADAEKIRIKVKEGLPPRVRGELTELLQDVFNQYEPVDTYQDGARVLRRLIESQMKEKVDRMVEIGRRGSSEYPYPNGVEIRQIQQHIQNLLQIHDAKSFVHAVLDAFDDIADGYEKLEHYFAFYNGRGIELFDRAVQLLTERANDLIAFDRDQMVAETQQAMELVLRHPNPYRQIPHLARLSDQLEHRLNELVAREAEEAVRYIEEVEEAVEGLQSEYGELRDAVSLIRETREQFQTYKEAVQRAKNRSTLATYREKASKDYHRLQEEIARLTGEESVVHFSLSNLIPPAGKRLNDERDIETFVNELRSHLLTKLKEGKIHLTR